MKAAAAFAIVNFVWQGAAIGLIAWLGFALSRSPRVRYFIGIVALVLMAMAPVITGAYFIGASEVHGPSSSVHGPLPSQVPGAASGSAATGRGTEDGSGPWTLDRGRWTFPAIPLDQRFVPLVLIAWAIGVVALSARLAIGFAGARRLTRRVREASASVQTIVNRLAVSLRIRSTVRVVESMLVKVPAVVGAFKPVVLLPAAAMSGLSMEQVEALLAHELAHVRRHDYLVNLLQSAIETLLFYHPVVWLVSRRVRQERELCCDDLALAVCGDRVVYAAALADLESLRAAPSPVLAANGGANLTLAADGGSLLARVRRILGHDDVSALSGRSKGVAGVAILASVVLLLFGQAARARSAQSIDELAKKIEPPKMQEFQAEPLPPGVEKVYGPVKIGPAAQGAVQGGVQGGAPGGVKGGVKSGVPSSGEGGVVGAVKGGVDGGIQVAKDVDIPEAPNVPTQSTVVGPFRVGDHIRIDLGYEGDPKSVRLFTTIQPAGVLNTADFNVQTSELALVHGVKVAGETSTTIADAIERRYRERSLTVPAIQVTFDDRHSDNASRFARRDLPPAPPPAPKRLNVTVQGAIRNPGGIALREERDTLADAIAAAGGFQSGAGSRIFLRRSNAPDRTFSKTALLQGEYANIKLQDGDTITVEVSQNVFVTGEIKSPGQYGWEEGMTVEKAIARAGGMTPNAGVNRITIKRKDPKTGELVSIRVTKLDMAVEPDDVVVVPVRYF